MVAAREGFPCRAFTPKAAGDLLGDALKYVHVVTPGYVWG